jgi:hypothetical protein
VEIIDARISEMADRHSAAYLAAMKALTTTPPTADRYPVVGYDGSAPAARQTLDAA